MSQISTHYLCSSHREMLLEHLFAGEVMKYLWLNNVERVEVLKPQVDDSGYDLVIEANSLIRHIQLKSSFRGSKVRTVNVSRFLEEKPSGCVVFIRFDQETLELGPFRYFGNRPGKPLPSLEDFKIAKLAKANSEGVKGERPNHRVVRLTQFERELDWDALLVRLFGPIL